MSVAIVIVVCACAAMLLAFATVVAKDAVDGTMITGRAPRLTFVAIAIALIVFAVIILFNGLSWAMSLS